MRKYSLLLFALLIVTVPYLFSTLNSIHILNPQEHPKIGEYWIVKFKAKGTGNLEIYPINGTEWFKDIRPTAIRCENKTINYSMIDDKILLKGYKCNGIGYEVSKVISPGHHYLAFKFGHKVAYARNYVVSGNVCNCTNCTDCMNALNNESCQVVQLINDIINSTNSCIDNPAGFSNKIFDCLNHKIDGMNKYYGILLADKLNVTIQNCTITEFENGVKIIDSGDINIINVKSLNNSIDGFFINNTNNITLDNVNSSSNENYGIYIERSNEGLIQKSVFCFNNKSFYDIFNLGSNITGSDNTCDKTYNYDDEKSIGCYYDCMPPSISFLEPTPPDNDVIPTNHTRINVSADERRLKLFYFYWNNILYSYYDLYLKLMFNFDNITDIEESSTHVVDLSKYLNNGVLKDANISNSDGDSPPKYVVGRYGKALSFDGIDDYIDCGNDTSLDMTDQFTIEMWIYPKSGGRCILQKKTIGEDDSSVEYMVLVGGRWDGTNLTVIINGTEINSGYPLSLNQWQYIAIVYNKGNVTFYVDGLNVSTRQGPSSITNSGGKLLIGEHTSAGAVSSDNGNYRFNGTIDEVRIWSKALGRGTILSHYKGNLRRYNLTHWIFEINKTNLSETLHAWKIYVYDTGDRKTEKGRCLTVDTTFPEIQYIAPDKSFSIENHNYIFVNITESDLHIWKTIFSLYNSSEEINKTIFQNYKIDSDESYYCDPGNGHFSPECLYGVDKNWSTYTGCYWTYTGGVCTSYIYENITVNDTTNALWIGKFHYNLWSDSSNCIEVWYYNYSNSSWEYLIQDCGLGEGFKIERVRIPSDGFNDSNLQIKVAVKNGAVGRVEYYEGAVIWSNTTRYVNWTNLPNGVYYFNVTVLDEAGNNNSTQTYQWIIDTQPPMTNVSCNNVECLTGWYSQDVIVNLSCSDALSGCNETFYCTNVSDQCSPDMVYTNPITITSENITYLKFYSVDKATNNESVKIQTVKIDKTKPKIIQISPLNTSWVNHDVNLSVVSDDLVSDVNSTYFIVINSSLSCPPTGNPTYTFVLNSTANITISNEGEWKVCTYAKDNAGLVSDINVSGVYQIDKTLPWVNITKIQEWKNKDFILNYTISDSLSGAHNCTLFTKNSTSQWIYRKSLDCNSNWTSIIVNSTGYCNEEGENKCQIKVEATDNANNTNFDIINVSIDWSKPSIVLNSPESGYYSQNYILINLTASDSVSGVASMSLRIYNSTGSLIYSNATSSSSLFINYSDLSDGIYYLNASSTDLAGNENFTSTKTIFIDTMPPDTTITGTSDYGDYSFDTWINKDINITLQCNDLTSGCNNTFYCIDTNNSCSPSTMYTGFIQIDTSGIYYIRFKSLDKAGNEELVRNATIKVDKESPEITLLNNYTVDLDGNVTLRYTVYDLSGVRNCSLILDNKINQTVELSNFTVQCLTPGIHNWSVMCTDIANNTNTSDIGEIVVIKFTKFYGTNLSDINISHIENFTIENDHGKIRFLEPVNLSLGGDIDKYVNITFNRIEINSLALPELNRSARLYLYNLTFKNPVILKDDKPCTECVKISYANGILVFDIPSFSVYSAKEGYVPSGGSHTGGGSVTIYECIKNEDCKNGFCINHTCYNYECLNNSDCKGGICINHTCSNLFDISILRADSPIQPGEFLDFTYLIKNIYKVNNDVTVLFWVEKDGKKIASGSETIYIGQPEEKKITTSLFLPTNIQTGLYTLFVQVKYGSYNASTHRTIEIGHNVPLLLDVDISDVFQPSPESLEFLITLSFNRDMLVPVHMMEEIRKFGITVWSKEREVDVVRSKSILEKVSGLSPGKYELYIHFKYGNTTKSMGQTIEIKAKPLKYMYLITSLLGLVFLSVISIYLYRKSRKKRKERTFEEVLEELEKKLKT